MLYVLSVKNDNKLLVSYHCLITASKTRPKRKPSKREVRGLFKVIDNDGENDSSNITEEEISELSEIAGL